MLASAPATGTPPDWNDQPPAEAWQERDAPHIDSPSIAADWAEVDEQDSTASNEQINPDQPPPARQDDIAASRRSRRVGKGTASATSKHKGRASSSLLAACIVMGAVAVSLMIWRADVVRLMPQTAAFFKMIGMGVNLRSLAFDDLKITTETVNNRPVLLIEGMITDIARKPVEIPRLRFIVRDAKGSEIYAWNAVLEQPVLNPGEKAWFKTRLASPPPEGREIAVRFFHKRDLANGGT